jgi:hypothetical protein
MVTNAPQCVFTVTVHNEIIFLYSQEPGSQFTVGSHQVTYTAIDGAGNRAQCVFTVTVNRIRSQSAPTRKIVVCPGRKPGKMQPLYPVRGVITTHVFFAGRFFIIFY